MPHPLHVLVLTTLAATALFGPTALAQPTGSTPVPPPPSFPAEYQYWAAKTWFGSASCHLIGSSPTTNYMGDETHTWEIVPWVVFTTGSMVFYAENWSATGKDKITGHAWTIKAKALSYGYLQFWLPPGSNLLHIIRESSGLKDPNGATDSNNNNKPDPVWEPSFPGPVNPVSNNFDPIVATPSIVDSVQGSSSLTTTGSIMVGQPSDGKTTWDCMWDFQYRPNQITRLPGPDSKSDTAAPVPPVVKKSSPDSVTPLVSVFFGGPGNGSVTGSPGVFSSEGATITLTATPDATSLFAGWGGSCSGTSATCTVTLGASNRVIAYFRSKFKSVAAGAYHTCALRPAGDVECWGINAEGEIGVGGPPTGPLAPSAVPGITTAVAIAAGGSHTCALLVGGTVTCWGKGNDGQLGVPSFPASASTPTTVPGISEALAVTAGGAHTCAVLAGGSASCWGLNDNQQLGASTPSYHSPTPVTVSTVGPLTKQIAAGAYHTCAIVAADSTVACWGLNSDGQAPLRAVIPGPGSGGPAAGCIIPPGGGDCDLSAGFGDIAAIYLNKVTTIAASIGVGQLLGGPPLGGYHTVALDSSGMDWGWGNNNDGQLPDGAGAYAMKDPSSPPVPAAVKIAAGAYHTCILDSTMGVYCRGNNKDSQSGSSPPGIVSKTSGAVDVAAGGYHTCAVIVTPSTPADGSVECWGLNWNGEVDGTSGGSAVTSPKVLTAVP
jgi:alpha-tubulin suppressor-like RCC1 family protein